EVGGGALAAAGGGAGAAVVSGVDGRAGDVAGGGDQRIGGAQWRGGEDREERCKDETAQRHSIDRSRSPRVRPCEVSLADSVRVGWRTGTMASWRRQRWSDPWPRA